jgi:hypothetical protein
MPRWVSCSGASVAALLASLAWPRAARADSPMNDPYDLPDAPRSLSLPELTHPDVEWTTTTTIGKVTTPSRAATEVLERLGVELPLGHRRWFFGAAYEAAYGAPLTTTQAPTGAGGDVEAYVRTVWATRTGLAFGGGLGFLPPIATFDHGTRREDVATSAASLVPTDAAYFASGVFTLRAFVDVRDLFGPFVIQFRESFESATQVHDTTDHALAAASTLYAGWLATPLVGLGVEANEYYPLDSGISDASRGKVVLAASARFVGRELQPAIGVFTGLGSPLAWWADSVWGARLSLTLVWDPRP